MSTIFKKIIDKEIPVSLVYEDDEIIAFNDINPQAPVHILIIPKKEIPTINDIDESEIYLTGKIIYTAKKIAEDLKIKENGYRLVFNCNKDGGQEVFHIHCHLLAGRKMNWPPG